VITNKMENNIITEREGSRRGGPRGGSATNVDSNQATGRGGDRGSENRRGGPDRGRRNNTTPPVTPPVTPPEQSDVFGCVFKGDNTAKKTKSPRQVMVTAGSGVIQKWFFFNNGDFVIKIGNIKEKTTDPRFIGKWECEGGDEFIIKTNDGFTYSSKTEEWVEKPNSGTSGSSNGTTIKLSDIKNGTKSVKIGTKGSVVTKIQDLLIGLGYNDVSNSGKSDGNFGPKTDGMVKKYQKDNYLKDDGIVGSKTITALLGGKSDATKVEPAVTATQPDSIQGTDGVIIKEKEKLDILQESVKKLLRKSLLGFRKK
jgi:hypothetical protein